MLSHKIGAASACGKRGERRMAARALRALLACTLALAFAFLPLSGARADAAHFGDLTGDGVLTAADAAVMLRRISSGALSADARPDCDYTQNGVIDETDVRVALFYLCGGIADMVKFSERVASGLCSETLFDRFRYTGTYEDESGTYVSENVAVYVSSGRAEKSNYYFVDIYVQDIACFATVFSQGEYTGGTETVEGMFARCEGGVIGMNGDYYSFHYYGPVVRNGVTYIDKITTNWDIAVLRVSGELETYPYGTLSKEALPLLGAYQTWVFGPALLDDEGRAKTAFRSELQSANPRSVLGYFEPGHYGFLVVDGREKESLGMTMQDLSALCEELGFVRAYNMDGGQSSVLIGRNGEINEPYNGGRPSSDILVIRELPEG